MLRSWMLYLQALISMLKPGAGENGGGDGGDGGGDGGDGGGDDAGAAGADGAGDEFDDLELEGAGDGGDGGDGKQQSRGNRQFAELRRRAQEQEAENERLRRQLEQQSRSAGGGGQPPADPDWEREEERLNDPNISDIERWQIDTNRTLRANARNTSAILAQAQDASDRANYSLRASANPIMQRYGDRVEDELAKMRAKGQNAPREAILRFIIGDEILKGNLKRKARPTGDGGQQRDGQGQQTGTRAQAGRQPPARGRSDVGGKGAPRSEHEKRRARLENQSI